MHPEREPDRASAERQFRLCRELGLTQARVAVEWATVEPERGRWDFAAMDRTVELAQAYGIELLEVLGCNPPWNTAIPGSTKTKPQDVRALGVFVQRMAERYRGRIRTWEVWNEPNSDTFLAGPCAARPEQRWLDFAEMLEAAQGDSARPVWITEVGLPTSGHELAVSEAQQAANIEPTFRVALRRAQVKEVFDCALHDDGGGFGLYRADGTPKPVAASLRDLCRRR